MLSEAPTPTSMPRLNVSVAMPARGISARQTSSAAALAGDPAVAVLGPIASVSVVVAAGIGLVVVEDYAGELAPIEPADRVLQSVLQRLAGTRHEHDLADEPGKRGRVGREQYRCRVEQHDVARVAADLRGHLRHARAGDELGGVIGPRPRGQDVESGHAGVHYQ